MAFVINDRVKETTTSTGTGTINLDGAQTGFQSFVSGIGNANETYYTISGGSEWEVGIGTVTDSATDTLSRTTVISSSNSGNLVSFSSGTKDVFCTLPASKATLVNTSNNVIVGNTNTSTAITTKGTSTLTLNTNENTNSGTISIVNGVNGNISITPNGNGRVVLDGLNWPLADGTASQFLQTNGSATLSFATVGAITIDTFNTGTAATWSKPSTANWVLIEMWGGGGSGARNTSNNTGGGGGGAYVSFMTPFSNLTSTVTYTVGAGGAAATTAANGNTGGNTSVTMNAYAGGSAKTVTSYGGGAGSNSTPASGGSGGGFFAAGAINGNSDLGLRVTGTGISDGGVSILGAAGFGYQTTSGCPTVTSNNVTAGGNNIFGGGGGGAAYGSGTQSNGGSSYYGGGGGAGHGSVSANIATGGTSVWGGGGGSSNLTGVAGGSGTLPAGGGAGGYSANSGAGGGGRIRFTYW